MPPYTLSMKRSLWLLDVPIHNQLRTLLLRHSSLSHSQKTRREIKTDKRDALRLAKLLKARVNPDLCA